MFELQDFLVAADGVGGNATLAITSNRSGLTARTGRVARWFARFRTAENDVVARRFVDALCRRYGMELTRRTFALTGFGENLSNGKPLRVRKVAQVVKEANLLQAYTAESNRRWAGRVLAVAASSGETPEGNTMLADCIRRVVRSSPPFQLINGASKLVDQRAIAPKIHDEIVARSRDGRHAVTPEEIQGIVTHVIRNELKSNYFPARDRAMQAMSLTPGSIAHEALSSVLARQQSSLHIGPGDLTDAAARKLCVRLRSSVADRSFPADRLDNRSELMALAEKEAQRFVTERRAARAAAESLNLLGDFDGAKKAALLAEVTRDCIPAQLVAELGTAYNWVEQDLARLAGPLTPKQLQDSISEIFNAITMAYQNAEIQPNPDNQAELNGCAWRFLLAPGGASQAQAIKARLAPADSLLREVGEGATWYAYDFPSSPEWARKLDGKGIHDLETRHRAGCYAELVQALGKVLDEIPSPDIMPLEWNDAPSDGAIAVLRNLEIPFPAPNRVGSADAGEVPLSDSQVREMDTNVRDHLRKSERAGTDDSGLARGCRDYIDGDHRRYREQRNRLGAGRAFVHYFIDSEHSLPQDREVVVRGLRDFCMEGERGSERLNRRLLAKVSAMAQRATLECVYAGCMNPLRPDTAIMNGDVRGAIESTAYRLCRGENGEVRLQIEEEIRPYWYTPMNKCAAERYVNGERGDNANPDRMTLSPKGSHFRTRIEVKFDPDTYDPVVDQVSIDYRLIEGVHDSREYPYIIRNPDVRRLSH